MDTMAFGRYFFGSKRSYYSPQNGRHFTACCAAAPIATLKSLRPLLVMLPV